MPTRICMPKVGSRNRRQEVTVSLELGHRAVAVADGLRELEYRCGDGAEAHWSVIEILVRTSRFR
jgi:hypothetical protein